MAEKGFFEKVWDIVAKIPKGRVATYGQIACLLDSPRAARTVGWALHSVPDNLDIPWQRVINAKGRISIDCGEHDPNIQRILLENEGVVFDEKDAVNLSVYQWQPDDTETEFW